MINTTDKILVVSDLNLDRSIRLGLDSVLAHLESRYGQAPDQVSWDSPHVFQHMFRKTNIRQGAKFGEGFLQEALQFVLTNSRNQGVSDFLNDLRGYIEGSATSATGIPSLKQGIKLLLVELWHKQIILLPTIFSAGSHFNSVPIVNELYSFIRSFEPKDQGQQQTARGVSGNARRLFFYMPRILWATNWRTIEDVSINELADLQRSQLLYLNGKSTVPTISSEAVPWSLFLTELHQQFPTRVGYSIDNLKQYSQCVELHPNLTHLA